MSLTNNPNLERPEKLIRQYAKYNLESQRFSGTFSYDNQRGGIPLMYAPQQSCIILDPTDSHTLVFGSSGSKKTRTVVMPTIHILCHAEESMIIHDAKGELYNRTAAMLVKNGYDVIAVNLRKPELGYAWNPLAIPYRYYKEGNIDRAAEFANDVASTITLGEIALTQDPFWEHSAHDCVFGLMLLLFRYCKENDLPDSMVNMANIAALRRALFKDGIRSKNGWLWKWGSEDELIANSLSGTVDAPDETMKSILSVLDQKLRTFTINNALMDMLSNSNFDIDHIGVRKTAVFLITPDEKTSYHPLVAIFISQSYQRLIYTAEENSGRISRRVNYILDEFSSLPAIGSDFPSMIAAARSRNIRFLLVAQSKNQLVRRYREEAATIMANCNNWIIMFTRELELLKEVSELCGTKQNGRPNVEIYDLQHLSKERNQALLLAGRLKPMVTELLDIKRLDGEKICETAFVTPERISRQTINLDVIPTAIKEKLDDKMKAQLNVFSTSSPSPFNPFASAKPSEHKPESPTKPDADDKSSNPFNMDDLIAKIDRKIAELEAEEELEKVIDQIKKRRSELANNVATADEDKI